MRWVACQDFLLFDVGDRRADARARIETDVALASVAQPLGERARWIEVELEKAGQILPLEFLILPDIGGDHLAHLAALEQQAEAEIVDPRIVRDDGEILYAAAAALVHQSLGNAAEAEAARRDCHSVEEQACRTAGHQAELQSPMSKPESS